MTCGIRECIGIAETQIDDLYFMPYARDEYVLRFKVRMNDLMSVEIPHSIEQLGEETLDLSLVCEIIGIFLYEI